MTKFLVLYMAPSAALEQMMRNATPEQQQKGMEAWMKWMGANQSSLVDAGAPLGKTKRVDAGGAKDTKNEVCGYSIVQAACTTPPPSCSAKTIRTCQCRAPGSRSSRSGRSRGCKLRGPGLLWCDASPDRFDSQQRHCLGVPPLHRKSGLPDLRATRWAKSRKRDFARGEGRGPAGSTPSIRSTFVPRLLRFNAGCGVRNRSRDHPSLLHSPNACAVSALPNS